eukprot:6482576-Amphidinium_carterae.2
MSLLKHQAQDQPWHQTDKGPRESGPKNELPIPRSPSTKEAQKKSSVSDGTARRSLTQWVPTCHADLVEHLAT